MEKGVEFGMTTIPHSKEAEGAVIGSVLINPDILPELDFLKSDDFHVVRNRFVWGAFQRLSNRRAPIDILTITEELDKVGQLSEIGGSAYLISLINQVPTSINAEAYGRIVEEHSIRRRMIQAANQIASLAYKGGDIDELVGELNQVITETIVRDAPENENLADAMSVVYDKAFINAERLNRGESINVGITTGFKDLDAILLGIESEESVLIAARPGQGKTSLLLDIGKHAALNLGKKVAIFSQEMSNEQIARRLIAKYAHIDTQKIKTGAMDVNEWTRFNSAIETYENASIFVMDTTGLTPAKLRAKCLQLKRTCGLDLILVDYLGLMSAGVKMENRTREMGYISRHIKLLNQELKTPIISAVQMSRAVEQRAEKRPVLSDLRDSGDLEQDANCVIFLYRENDSTLETNVIVAKRRDGAVGECTLIYEPKYATFRNAYVEKFGNEEARIAYAINSAVGSED